MRSSLTLCLGMVLCAAGCSREADWKEVGDDNVRDGLFTTHERREAIPFFEQKGRYVDVDASTTVDRDVVLPLLKRLQEVATTEQWVMIRPTANDWAGALVVELPDDPETVDRMAQVVQEADDQFPGFIVQQWGHEWLAMDFLEKETYEFLKKSNPDMDQQR
jgi:hypothetical protein